MSMVIADTLRRVEAQAKAQGVSLDACIDPDLPQVWGDPLRLRAVVDNVLSNALKYTPSGGTITVTTLRSRSNGLQDPETVSTSITDTGPGVPMAFRERIFDKFFRLEHHQAEARPPARGAGIGLYMCRQIVELQRRRDHVWFRSERSGDVHHGEPAGKERHRRSRRD